MNTQNKAMRLASGKVHQARKRFGQNFLHDQSVIDRIITAIAPRSNQHLIEIGPGQGALTRPLATSAAKLDCVELDRDLAEHLQSEFSGNPRISIYQQDVLKLDLNSVVDDCTPESGLRIVGNLPYNISTPVIFHLLTKHELIADMTFMLQLEVVQRLAAQAGNKNYGRLGLMAQYFCHIEHLFNVPSAAFTPKPKVSSAIVRLTPHKQFTHRAKNVETLQMVIRTAFNQRRKTLKNSLKAIISEWEIEKLGIDGSQRPENLLLSDYVNISDAVANG